MKKKIEISFDGFTVNEDKYPEGTKKAGEKRIRLIFKDRTMDSLLATFKGSKEGLLKFVETKLGPTYVAQQADPDKLIKKAARDLCAALPTYFTARGFTPADGKDLTKDELKIAVVLLKDPTATHTA
jgi:hypothetical protein